MSPALPSSHALACLVRAIWSTATATAFTYDYFRRQLEIEQTKRKAIFEIFDKVIENWVR